MTVFGAPLHVDSARGSGIQTGKHTPEQIVAKLRRAEVELAKGRTIPQVSKQLGITDQTLVQYSVAPRAARRQLHLAAPSA